MPEPSFCFLPQGISLPAGRPIFLILANTSGAR